MITYNPENRSGRFSKDVYIILNGGDTYVQTKITGNVVPYLHPVTEDYPYAFGEGLYMSNKVLPFAYQGKDVRQTTTLRIANDTRQPMEIIITKRPGNKVLRVPARISLKPLERTTIDCSYAYPRQYSRDRVVWLDIKVNGKAVKPMKVVLYGSRNVFNDLSAGSKEAFEYLFTTYYPRLRNYASHFIADVDDVGDIMQDCFVNLWNRRAMLTGVSISSMLFTMVRNGCLNFLKHKAIAEGYNTCELKQISGSEALYNYDFLGSADEELLYDELRRQIGDVLRRLPERSRQVFVMSRFEGLKNREIAERLDISVKVVEKHITKSLALLREYISRHGSAELCLLLLSWMLR